MALRTLTVGALTALTLAAPTAHESTHRDSRELFGSTVSNYIGHCIGHPSQHCDRSWGIFQACECASGWMGACCDRPSTCTMDNFVNQGYLCPQDMMTLHHANTAAFGDKATTPMRIGKAPLPAQLRGVFWLKDQGDSSSLVSFAASNDGDGVSPGVMPADGVYKVRVRGDRTWSFADKSFNWEASGLMDLIYSFNFNDAENPTEAIVYGGGGNALSVIWKGVTYAVEFGMELLQTTHERYTTSVVWNRPSRFAGQTISQYTVVQVMDEDGNKLEPAYSDWVAYNQLADTGNTPDKIFYFVAQ